MPWKTEWVPPEVAVEYKGVKVYHTYNGDEYKEKLTFWFTLKEQKGPEDYTKGEFDVRKLATWESMDHIGGQWERIKQTIRAAIDLGELKPKGAT